MPTIDFNRPEQELRAFDGAFYDRLHAASPMLAWAVANIINIELDTQTPCDSEDAWAALHTLPTRQVARRLGIPLQVIRKVPVGHLGSLSLTQDLAMLKRVLLQKPKCGRFLRHCREINLGVVRAMYLIECDDAALWRWLGELDSTTVDAVTDHLIVIDKVLRQTGRRWQAGMVRSETSLARTYERLLAIHFPEPPFTDEPHCIEAIRSGSELARWGLQQRNCVGSYINACMAGDKIAYRMLTPAPGTLLISLEEAGKPWLVDARAHANGEPSIEQISVLTAWCDRNGINTNGWLMEGAR